MTDKELRRLTKGDLIEIIYKMKKTEEELRVKLEASDARLRERNLKIEKAGSIAEAAISVNGVFEAAQKAADDYLQQVYATNAEIETRCARMLAETEAECRKREQETEEIINSKWAMFEKKAQEYIGVHAELSNLLKK